MSYVLQTGHAAKLCLGQRPMFAHARVRAAAAPKLQFATYACDVYPGKLRNFEDGCSWEMRLT